MARFLAVILAAAAMLSVGTAAPHYPMPNGTVPERAPKLPHRPPATLKSSMLSDQQPALGTPIHFFAGWVAAIGCE
ncbi:hypothetical protein F5Y15DRAFT_420866 [Xylariaceae sp. FL0016]|nr:hypothetical protein F5Y15DRAFT_420866 [Xylariaceae sp. FL0016]